MSPPNGRCSTVGVGVGDVWGTAVIALVTVGNDAAHLHSQLQKAVLWLENHRPDVPITDYEIEIIS